MFALSSGICIPTSLLLETIFNRQYRGKKFVCYNLKYDEGAILYHLPKDSLNELRNTGKTVFDGYGYRSIPKKELVISKGHKSASFYDIAQFYGTSLNKAALYYLGKEKKEIDVSKFEAGYVKRNWHKIAEYCIHDAKITAELADYFIDVLSKEFNIYPQKLYSTGYIAGIHFARVCDVIDINRFCNYYPELVKYAYESYVGGKFEVYKRGYDYFYQYDINSAYPYQISQLKDIRYARVKQSNTYQNNATYGWLKCEMILSNDFSPVAVKINNVNRYPVGGFSKIITKQEYDYLIAQGEKIKIKNAWWLWCDDVYPYKAEVERLYSLKIQLKTSHDKLRYLLIKTILNAFYGKFIQVTTKHKKGKKVFEAGYLFNPMYASIITANTRIKLSDVCNNYPDNVVAVFTDCVITNKNLTNSGFNLSNGLGSWQLQRDGEGVIIGSGVYQIGDNVHYRGYKAVGDLIALIDQKPHRINIKVKQRLVLSWRLVVFRNTNTNKINRFTNEHKVLDLHFDKKRDWSAGWDWKHRLVNSEPFIHIDLEEKLNKSVDKCVTI